MSSYVALRKMPFQALFPFLIVCCSVSLWDAQLGHAVYAGVGGDSMYEYPTEAHRDGFMRNATMMQDSTLPHPDPDWFGPTEETLSADAGTLSDSDTSGEFASYPLPRYAQHQPSRPGMSLITLADLLRRSDPQLRAAILRHFAHSVAKLRNQYVGLGNRTGSLDQLRQGSQEIQVEGLLGKLKGLVSAADSYATYVAMSAPLLIPFGVVVREVEDVLYIIARKGDATAMISALDGLGPLLVQGLSYIGGDSSAAASGIINPVRESLIKRARELDAALLEGQRNPRYLLHRYSSDMSEEFLDRERRMAELEGGEEGVGYVPPPRMSDDFVVYSTSERRKGVVVLTTFLLVMFIFFVAMASIAESLTLDRDLPDDTEMDEDFSDFVQRARRAHQEAERQFNAEFNATVGFFSQAATAPPASPPLTRHMHYSSKTQRDEFISSNGGHGIPTNWEPRTPWNPPPPSYNEVMHDGRNQR